MSNYTMLYKNSDPHLFGAFYSYFIVGSIFWARFIKIKQLLHLRLLYIT